MERALYEHELADTVPHFKRSMKIDKEDYVFTVIANDGQVAMLLIERVGKIYINEEARERLKTLWMSQYEINMKKLMPTFAMELAMGALPQYGVKTTKSKKASKLNYINSLK